MALTPPTITADSTQNDLAHNIELTFTDDAGWRGAITSITIDGEPCETNSYNVEAGKITIQWRNFRRASDHAIVIIATGYDNASVTQTITVARWSELTFFEVVESDTYPITTDNIDEWEPFWGNLTRKTTIHDIVKKQIGNEIRIFWASWEKKIRAGQSTDSLNSLNYIKNPRELKDVVLFYAIWRLCLAQFKDLDDGYNAKAKLYYLQYTEAKRRIYPVLEFEKPVSNYDNTNQRMPRFMR